MKDTKTAEKTLTPTQVRRNRVQMQRLRAQTMEIAEDLKCGLMSADRDAKVVKLLDHMITKGARLKDVKGSDSISAAKMYADRRWPTRQEQAPASYTFASVNLNVFLPDPQPATLGAPVDTTCSVLEDGKQTREKNLDEFNTCNVR